MIPHTYNTERQTEEVNQLIDRAMAFVARPLEVVDRCCLEQQQQQQVKEDGGSGGQGQGQSMPARVAEAFRGTFVCNAEHPRAHNSHCI